jgi:predicted nuclease with TOPRIM domain
MDVKDFCAGMETELMAWKAKLYDTWRKFEKLGTAEREKIQPKIEDLHMVVEELSARLDQLKTECPSDWSPIKKEIEDGHVDMRGKYEETMEEIGKASPVSIPG